MFVVFTSTILYVCYDNWCYNESKFLFSDPGSVPRPTPYSRNQSDVSSMVSSKISFINGTLGIPLS
jgi:hypothetical protein